MSQNDYVIANQTTPLFRADLNLALQALASNSSGSSAPSITYANMMWYDITTNILKMRSEADDAWITLGTLDQSLNTFTPAGLTNLSQAQVEDDTSTVFGQVSGQRLAQAVDALVPPDQSIGVGQTWQAVSRSANVWYQNTTGRSIVFQMKTSVTGNLEISVGPSTSVYSVQSWGDGSSGTWNSATVIIPPNHYYIATGSGMSITSAQELR